MAWTAVPTVVIGQMIDSPWLNTYLRDNMLVAGTHEHASTGSGEGTRGLGGTAGLAQVILAQAAAPSAPTGTLTKVFASGSMLGWISSGGTARMGVDTNHTHGY